MKAWRPALGVRARLTLWYVAAMLIVLAVYAAGVFGFVRRSVSDALDERVRSDFRWAAEMWEQQAGRHVHVVRADDRGPLRTRTTRGCRSGRPTASSCSRRPSRRRNPMTQSAAARRAAAGAHRRGAPAARRSAS